MAFQLPPDAGKCDVHPRALQLFRNRHAREKVSTGRSTRKEDSRLGIHFPYSTNLKAGSLLATSQAAKMSFVSSILSQTGDRLERTTPAAHFIFAGTI